MSSSTIRNPFTWPVLGSLALSIILLLVSFYGLGPPGVHDSLGLDFWRTATHEAGFAFAVSAVIWVCFEYFKSTSEDDHWNERIETISKNVFFGVWKKNFPDGLIKEAGRLILDQTFIRTNLHLVYSLNDATYKIDGEDVQFARLNTVATCRVRNVSNDVADLAIGIALPNPMLDELKKHCGLKRVEIKKKGKLVPIAQEVWDNAEAKFREALCDDKATMAYMDLGTIAVAPDEELEMVLDYNMAKEFEDSEVFTTRLPADSVTITINDHGKSQRAVRARSIHTRDLDNDTSEGAPSTYCFKLMEWLLPEQGFVIWWKAVPVRPASKGEAT